MEEKIQTINKTILNGYIVGIYDKDGNKVAKIKFDSGFIELIIKSTEDIHLGDGLKIKGSFKIEEISQFF